MKHAGASLPRLGQRVGKEGERAGASPATGGRGRKSGQGWLRGSFFTNFLISGITQNSHQNAPFPPVSKGKADFRCQSKWVAAGRSRTENHFPQAAGPCWEGTRGLAHQTSLPAGDSALRPGCALQPPGSCMCPLAVT